MDTENEVSLGGYYGIQRELIHIAPTEVIIRFYPLGEEDSGIEFIKHYNTKSEAINSIQEYSKNTTVATKEEVGPNDGNWKSFEKKVNSSMIQLYRDVVKATIKLPDGGTGYLLNNKKVDDLKYWLDRFDAGEDIKFVNYHL